MKIFECLTIPTFAERRARWRQRVDLSGHRYTLEVAYNTLQDAWVMHMKDVNGELLIAGIRLVPGIYLFEKFRAISPGLPPGELILVDLEGRPETAEVTRQNLGTRFALTYQIITEE